MASKWFEMAKQTLKPGDEVQKSYKASHNGQSGYVVMSNQKLIFVSEKGFLSRSYNVDLEVPYNKVDEIRLFKNRLTLVVRRHRYEFISDHAVAMEQSLKDLK